MYKFLYLFEKSNKICLIQQIKKNIVKKTIQESNWAYEIFSSSNLKINLKKNY
jgi:hypothetical protein